MSEVSVTRGTLATDIPLAPPARTDRRGLPSGMVVELAMPDLFAVLGAVHAIPDALTAQVIRLLKDEGSYTPERDPRKFKLDAEYLRGMYAIASLCLVSPRLNINQEYGDGETLGRRDLPWEDVRAIYAWFQYDGGRAYRATPAPEPSGDAGAVPAGDDVPQDASGTDGD